MVPYGTIFLLKSLFFFFFKGSNAKKSPQLRRFSKMRKICFLTEPKRQFCEASNACRIIHVD